jgi:hypothetical protein
MLPVVMNLAPVLEGQLTFEYDDSQTLRPARVGGSGRRPPEG